MRAMITPSTSRLVEAGVMQELPYLSDIMQVIVDCLTSLINLFCRQTTSQGESRDEHAVYFRR